MPLSIAVISGQGDVHKYTAHNSFINFCRNDQFYIPIMHNCYRISRYHISIEEGTERRGNGGK